MALGVGRAVVLGSLAGLDEARQAALRSTLSCSPHSGANGASTATPGHATRQARAARFLRWPEVVVTRGFGLASAAAALYRTVSGRAVFLVFLDQPPGRVGWLGRLVLRIADGVLVDGEAAARAASGAGFPARAVYRIPSGSNLCPFLRIEPVRSATESRRLVVVGDLDPGSGAADLLIAVMAWAELHLDEDVELCWVGNGDLSSVLAAQPLPRNVSQTFPGPPAGTPGSDDAAEAVAAAFARSGLLVVPSMLDAGHAPVAEALAAGLPVVGSSRSREVRRLVTEGANGWLFDPLVPDSLFACLSRALATPPQALAAMRGLARASVAPTGPTARIRRHPAAAPASVPLAESIP